MSRGYNHISKYEKEILEMKLKGMTRKEIGEELVFSKAQTHNFITMYNRRQALLLWRQ